MENTPNQIQKYLTFDQIPPLNQFQTSDELFTFLSKNFNVKNWTLNLQALNVLRQINKHHTSEMPNLLKSFKIQILNILKDPKTILKKNSLIFLQELFHMCKNILPDEIIFEFEPIIVKLVFNNKSIIKKEAQSAFDLMVTNCIGDGLIVGLSKSSTHKDLNISRLSFRALERVVIIIKDKLNLLQENSIVYLFKAITKGLECKKKQLYNIAKNINKIIFTQIGQQNYVNFILGLSNKNILSPKDLKNIENSLSEKKNSDFKQKSKDIKNLVKKGRQHMKNLRINSNFVNQNNY